MAGDPCGGIGAVDVLHLPPVARSHQNRIKLAVDQLFDEPPDTFADSALDRINAGVSFLTERSAAAV